MSRKIWFGIAAMLIVAIVAGLSVSGIALASAQPASQGQQVIHYGYMPQRSVSGSVVRVSQEEFSIRTRFGQELTFSYGMDTRFVDPQHKAVQGAELKVGDQVTVFAQRPDRDEMGVTGLLMGHPTASDRQFDRRFGRFGGIWERFPQSDADDAVAIVVVIGQPASAAHLPAKPAAPAATVAPTAAPTQAPAVTSSPAAGASSATPTVTPTPKP
jgi:hypothetical protein